MKQVLLSIVVLMVASTVVLANSAPNVSNVTASQRADGSGIVDIYYRLTDADNDVCTVTVVVSDDDGDTWTITPSDSALFGEGQVAPGNDVKHILWFSKNTLPGEYGSNYRVRICAEDGGNTTGPIPPSHFLRVPPNSSVATTTFEMGDHYGVGGSNELPIHTVTLDAFYMCKYETTNEQYRDYLNDALSAGQIIVDNYVVYAADDTSRSEPYFSTWNANSYSQIRYNIGGGFYGYWTDGTSRLDYPVVMVSWYGANAFCDYYGYRLPTEAQWERAARSGNLYYQYPWGSNTIDSTKCNYNMNNPMGFSSHPYTTPVGNYSSPTGFYDMAGNVWEWCADWYGSYPSGPQTNPTGPGTGSYRVIRGGCWNYGATYCRVADRLSSLPNNRDTYLGFRVCLD